MGRTHIGAYRGLGDACRISGVFDLDAGLLSGGLVEGGNLASGESTGERLFEPAEVFATDSLDALLARVDVDAVSVCTPTDTHVDVALAAMRAGKHVLVEKPVSLERAGIQRLAAEAERAGVICMPAMCMRFWPGWVWLKEKVRVDGIPKSISFERLGSAPGWGGGFYQDAGRCGGALHDLHIHDTDFVCHLFGKPDAVSSVGDQNRLTTMYHYEDGPRHVVAAGGWLRGGAEFRMRYVAEFEDATADFDLSREPGLLWSSSGDEGCREPADVGEGDGYEGEARAFVGAIIDGVGPPVTLDDAAMTLAVLEAEAESLKTGERQAIRLY